MQHLQHFLSRYIAHKEELQAAGRARLYHNCYDASTLGSASIKKFGYFPDPKLYIFIEDLIVVIGVYGISHGDLAFFRK